MKSTKTSIFTMSNIEHAFFAQRCVSFNFIGLGQWYWYAFSHLVWKPKVTFDYFLSISFIPTFKILVIPDNSFIENIFLFPVLKVIFIWCHFQTSVGSTIPFSGISNSLSNKLLAKLFKIKFWLYCIHTRCFSGIFSNLIITSNVSNIVCKAIVNNDWSGLLVSRDSPMN